MSIKCLVDKLSGLKSYIIAFSGGVDSSYLVAMSAKIPGIDFVAVTVDSALIPECEIEEAKNIAALTGARHRVVELDVLSSQEVSQNPPDRCYICKKAVLSALTNIKAELGLKYIIDGTNADDLNDYRPGKRALDEVGVISPLSECGFTKADIRAGLRDLGMPNWDAPAMACLATRIPYNTPLTVAKLEMVEEAEAALRALGYRGARVRCHDNVARIEVAATHMDRVLQDREIIVEKLKEAGFDYISLDLSGYRTGAMNETLK